MEKKFVIYRNGKKIKLATALTLDPDMPNLYWPVGPASETNPHYCIAVLTYLSEQNLIESWAFTGSDEELVVEQEEERVY